MAFDQSPPSWQSADCPPWCRRVHHEDDHLDDRTHQTTGRHVPVVRAGGSGVDGFPRAGGTAAEEWVVYGFGETAGPSVWVFLGQDEGREVSVRITRDSAALLAGALEDCVADLAR